MEAWHLGVSQVPAQRGALHPPELLGGSQAPPEGQLVVTGTVSLKSALRADGCLSARSRLNRGSEHPIPGGVQAEELRCASKIFANACLQFPGCQEATCQEPRGHYAEQEPCTLPGFSSLAVSSWAWQGLLRRKLIKKLLPTLPLPTNAQAQAGRLPAWLCSHRDGVRGC